MHVVLLHSLHCPASFGLNKQSSGTLNHKGKQDGLQGDIQNHKTHHKAYWLPSPSK